VGDDATVSITLVRVVLRALRPEQANALLAELGVSPVQLADDSTRLPRELSTSAWRRAPEISGDESFGLHLAEQLPFGTFGVLELVARSSRTLREGLDRLVHYYRILDGRDALAIESDASSASLIFNIANPNRHVAECLMATMSRALRELWTGFSPREVWFQHTAPADPRDHERIIGVPVRFGRPSTRLVFDVRDLDRVMPSPDRQALATIESDEQPLADKVRDAISQLLGGSDCSSAAAAKRLGLSERTLRRRLAEAGTTFSELVDETRSTLAKRHLADPRLSVYEVALALGFSDQRSFARAFKRWTGSSPLEFRAAHAS